VNALDSSSSDAGITRYWWLDGNIAVADYDALGTPGGDAAAKTGPGRPPLTG
jgi:hypothetical protein